MSLIMSLGKEQSVVPFLTESNSSKFVLNAAHNGSRLTIKINGNTTTYGETVAVEIVDGAIARNTTNVTPSFIATTTGFFVVAIKGVVPDALSAYLNPLLHLRGQTIANSQSDEVRLFIITSFNSITHYVESNGNRPCELNAAFNHVADLTHQLIHQDILDYMQTNYAEIKRRLGVYGHMIDTISGVKVKHNNLASLARYNVVTNPTTQISLDIVDRELDNPVCNYNQLDITVPASATTSPDLGGFQPSPALNTSSPPTLFITRLVAKVPVGYNITLHANSLGTNGSDFSLDLTGTGEYKAYYRFTLSNSGNSHGHTAITGPNTGVKWTVAEHTSYEVISNAIPKTSATIGVHSGIKGKIFVENNQPINMTMSDTEKFSANKININKIVEL